MNHVESNTIFHLYDVYLCKRTHAIAARRVYQTRETVGETHSSKYVCTKQWIHAVLDGSRSSAY